MLSESKPEVPLRAQRYAKRTQWKRATAEGAVFTDVQLQALLALTKSGIAKLVERQKSAVS